MPLELSRIRGSTLVSSTFPVIIKLELKWLTVSNTLAYYDAAKIMTLKCFIVRAKILTVTNTLAFLLWSLKVCSSMSMSEKVIQVCVVLLNVMEPLTWLFNRQCRKTSFRFVSFHWMSWRHWLDCLMVNVGKHRAGLWRSAECRGAADFIVYRQCCTGQETDSDKHTSFFIMSIKSW